MTGMQLFKNQSNLFKDDDNSADDIEVENNQLEDLKGILYKIH
jgi:hypothetical protein